jgi:SAM-dependent methyltransferase
LFDSTNKFPYAESLFKHFGAVTVDAIDYSDYEGANIIHDMNLPIPDSLKNKYDCVWDGGTLEHVFNYPIAIKNCMEMVKTGGHLILETPGNNQYGHGFYQFSPELFFSLLDRHNGFIDTKIFTQDDFNRWYEIIPPKITKMRTSICLRKKKPTLSFVISKKINDVPDMISVLQSDYVETWNYKTDEEKIQNHEKSIMECCKELYLKFVPKRFQSLNLALFGMGIISKFLYTKKRMYKPAPEFSRAHKKGK